MSLHFSPNERVLCYHGPLIYEAKILKTETWDEANTRSGIVGPHFFIHYKGWKQTWDEWVPLSRVLKFNEENLTLQKQLQANAKAAQATLTSASKAQKGGTSAASGGRGLPAAGRKEGTRGTKRGREEDDGTRKPDMKLIVPDILKVQLVDDWEAVTRNCQLVSLPRTPTVEDVLNSFSEYVLALPKPPPKAASVLPTITSGLKLYFDRALGTTLLYRFERPQYLEQRRRYVSGRHVIVGQEKEMSQVYGAEHLLRMIVSLPNMVAQSTMDQESVTILKEYVNELMNYMVLERSRIFQQEYETASSQYQSLSRS